MVVFRICRAEFSTDLNASGLAGRWNKDGQWVLYASSTRSLAALEQLVNRSGIIPNAPYCVMSIEVPDTPSAFSSILTENLPSDWRPFSSYGRLQELGSNWYRKSEALLLKVPSVLIPQECNYLINTQFPDFSNHVRLLAVEEYTWDSRFT